MPDRYRRRPFDAWDPYRDDPTPGRRSRWRPRRLVRLAVPLLIAALSIGQDLWRMFEPKAPISRPAAASDALPAQPNLDSNRLIMPDPRSALPRPAQPADSPGDWITSDDYPPSALRENLQGTVSFRFTVQPDGHVRDCVPTGSSGSALLDSTACGIFTLHARYWPARDAQGLAIAETRHQTVKWQIPRS